MELNKQTIKKMFLLICGAIAFFLALQNLKVVFGGIHTLVGMLSPFLLGGAIAFVLNVPMRAIERKLFAKAGKQNKMKRPISLVLALLFVIGILTLAGLVIVPGIKGAMTSLADQIPTAFAKLQEQVMELETYLPQMEQFLAELSVDWGGMTQKAVSMLRNWGSDLISSGSGLVGGVISGVTTFVIALIFSFYLLVQKEKLARQGKQVLYALLPEKKADRALEILRLTNRTFSNFLSGQCLEAVILGALFVAAMTVLRIPYALLVGVLIAITALIPIVGAFIGCGVGAFLIAMVSPMKALIFIVLFLVLQQLEGNLIYPHVVGSSVGLPSIWVLAAVTLGGTLMGITGILLFIPLCSVLYALFRDHVKQRLVEKKIPDHKWKDS